MIRRFTFLLSLLIMGVACNEPVTPSSPATPASTDLSEEVKELKEKVISRHDTAMARMNTIASLQRQLRGLPKAEDSAAVVQASADLQAARDAMMDWMRQFALSVDSSEQAQLRYLNDELVRINEVDQKMLSAIRKSRELLASKESD